MSVRTHCCGDVVKFSGVSFSYDGIPVLTDVHATICPGDFVSIVGPNGGGKTTLLKLILGLETPTGGTVKVFGASPDRARGRVGYVAQYLRYDPTFPVSVLDVALMGRLGGQSWWGRFGRNDRDAAMDALYEVALDDLADRPFQDLSGGQRQRVLIARALACEPELLLLDEATSHLDIKVEEQLFQLLDRLNDRMTIAIVSHDLAVVSQHVRSVLCVRGTVHVHPTSELTGELISAMYGGDIKMVRHDHRCSEDGHTPCTPS